MKDNYDGFTVDNMNSQDLKEGDDQPKDDNSECFFNNSVASDQRSDISSSKNSEISECDSGVASLQETYCHIADKNKTSHSYFNSRTGTSFIHINSLNRHIIKNHNSYIEKEWELLKKKMIKPLLNKIPNESLEEQKKDISFIDEPDVSNNNNSSSNMKPNHHNFSLQNKNPEIENSTVSKIQLHKQSNKSSLDKTDSICSLASSFYEPKDDYIGSSFSKTFLNYSTQSFLTKTSLSSSVFTKPLSSIKTSLSHSNTEIVSCIYNPVSSASPFNSSNPNPFNVQSYKDEFLSLDPNYVPRQLPTITTSSFQNSYTNILSSTPNNSFTSTNKIYQENKAIETIGFSKASNNENNCNNATKNSFTLKEYPPTTISSNPVLLESDKEISSKSARYQEMAQRKKMKNRKEKDQVITSDKVPDYIGNKDMDHILKYINNEKPDSKTFNETKDKGKKSKKKVAIPVASTLGSKNCCKPCSLTDKNFHDNKNKSITVEKNEDKVMNIRDEKELILTDLCSKETSNLGINKKVSSEDTKTFEKVIERKTKMDSHEPPKIMTSPLTNGVESINSLDHIDKFSNFPLTFKKDSSKTKELVQKNFVLNECDMGFEGHVSKASNFSIVTKRKKVKSKHQQNTKTQESPDNDRLFVKNKLPTPLAKPSSANSAKSSSRHMDNNTKIATGVPAKPCNSFTRPVSSPQLQTSFMNLTQEKFNLTKSTFASPTDDSNAMHATTTLTSPTSTVSSTTLTTISNHHFENSISFNVDSEAKSSTVSTKFTKKLNPVTNKQNLSTSQAFFLDTKNLDKTLNNDIDFMFGYDGDVKATNATKFTPASKDCSNIDLNKKIYIEEPQKENVNKSGNHNALLFVNKSIVNMTSNHDVTSTTSIDQPKVPHNNATPSNQEGFNDTTQSKQQLCPLEQPTPLHNISFTNHSTQPPIIYPQLYLSVNMPLMKVSTSGSLIATQNTAQKSNPSVQNNHQHHPFNAHPSPNKSLYDSTNYIASAQNLTYTTSFSTTKPLSKSLSPVSFESSENTLQKQWDRPQQNQFNLHKAQIYLDTIFKEVLNSKDFKIYPSTG